MKISVKITLPVILFIVIAVVLTSIIGYSNIYREINNVMKVSTESVTESLIETIELSQKEAQDLKLSLNSNFIRIARTIAHIIDRSETIPDTLEMQALTQKIGIDEIHIIGNDGVLYAGSVPDFYGFDFATNDQTKPFLQLLGDKTSTLAQDPSYRAVDGVLFQYIGVPLQDRDGFIQIGVRPTELQDLLKSSSISNIISTNSYQSSGYGYFIHNQENIITAHSIEDRIGLDMDELEFGPEILNKRNGSFTYTYKGVEVFTSFREIANGIVVTSVPTKAYRQKLVPILVSLIITVILSITISTLILVYLINRITSPIGYVSTNLEEIASGDLTREIDKSVLQRDDEIGTLANSLLLMSRNLQDTITKVSSTSEQVTMDSIDLANGNRSLSQRTEQQAAALEETSAAIEQMNGAIRSNAENTSQADELSRETMDKTQDSSDAVSIMIDSMNDINDSSNRIADIIDVINNIAFQTNLLALNASIEAARAGEQGKGFAVVAVEVRKLAKKSDRAASEITEIIKSSNQIVDEGVNNAKSAGNILLEVKEAVNRVTELIGEISTSSKEQLSSIDQIDTTLAMLDKNTQENAKQVEEASNSTTNLSNKAVELNDHLQFFTVKRDSNLFSKTQLLEG